MTSARLDEKLAEQVDGCGGDEGDHERQGTRRLVADTDGDRMAAYAEVGDGRGWTATRWELVLRERRERRRDVGGTEIVG